MSEQEYLSVTDAAKAKECSRTTIYRAADDGRINDAEIAGKRLIVADDAWRGFEPKETGFRLSGTDTDTSSTPAAASSDDTPGANG